MTHSRARTRVNYDRLSRWYDLLAGSSERACRLLGLSLLDVRPGERVLEVGCGTGQALRLLSEAAGPAGCVWGLDLSRGMCQVVRSRDPKLRSVDGALAVICGDAVALPTRDRGCDAVFMSFALELFVPADMTRLLAECSRVLCDSGRLGVVALAESKLPGVMERLYVRSHQRFPAWVDCRPIPVAAVLIAHGFRVQQVIQRSMWGLPVEVVLALKK